jgi:hypothetical protein
MRKRIILALCSAAVALGLALPGMAGATVHPHAVNIFNVNIKNNNGAGPITVTDKNGTLQIGATVSGSSSTGNNNQHWDLTQNTAACGDGFVHNASACPFQPGSGLNALYNGDVILRVCLHFSSGFCMAQQTSGGLVNLQAPNGPGTNWISDSPNHLVNRVVSDSVGQGECLFNDSVTGDPLNNQGCDSGTNSRIGWEVNGF